MKRATCKCMGIRMHKDRYIGILVKMYLVLVCFVLNSSGKDTAR